MFAALSAVAEPFTVISLPLAGLLLVAAASIVFIGVVLRRLRTDGTFTFAHASTGVASASLVLAIALLAGAALGGAPHSAQAATSGAESVQPMPQPLTRPHTQRPVAAPDDYKPIDLSRLEGYQLPTE